MSCSFFAFEARAINVAEPKIDSANLLSFAQQFFERINPKLEQAKEDSSASKWLIGERVEGSYDLDPWSRIADGEELIFSLLKGNLIFSESMFVQKNSKGVYISLSEFLTSLNFPIEFDFEAQKAEGWFIREDRTIAIDFSNNSVLLQGQSLNINNDDYILDEANYDIYVKENLIKRLFGIELVFNVARLQIEMVSSELLPFEEKLLRQKRESTILNTSNEPILPRIKQDYKAVTQPFIDLQYSQTINKSPDTETNLQNRYSVIAANDFLYGGTKTFISGNDQDNLSQVRVTWTREADEEEEDLGVLGIDRVQLGDVIPTNTNIFDGVGQEFGFRVDSQTTRGDNEQTDITEFQGDIPPGWDVELYNNGVLIDSQEASIDGRYLFEDVVLNFGENNFRLAFYGPQGQVQEEFKTILRNKSRLEPGQQSYSFSVTNRGEITYDVGDNIVPDQGSLNMIGFYERGITEDLLLSLGGRYHKNNGNNNIHTSLGLTHFGDTGIYEFNLGSESQGGLGVEVTALTKLWGQDVRLRNQLNTNDFDTSSPDSDNIVSFNEMNIRGDLSDNLSYNTTGQYLLLDSGGDITDLNMSLAKSFRRGTSTLSYDFNETNIGDTSTENQSISLNSTYNLGGAFVRGNITYGIAPEFEARSYFASLVNRFNKDLGGQFELEHFVADNRTEGRVRLNFKNDNIIISPNIQYDTEDALQAIVSVRLGVGQDPYSGSTIFSSNNLTSVGGVSSRVFLDDNNNGLWDIGEEPVSNARIKAIQTGRRADTNEQGIAFLANLGEGQVTDIALDQSSLQDPYFLPIHEGNSIRPRAGRVTPIDFPIVISGEVDGVVSIVTSNGVTRPSRKMIVELIDESGNVAQSVDTAYDGFFVIGDIKPGRYQLKISDDLAEKRNMIAVEPIGLNFSAKGDVFFDQTFTSFSENIEPEFMKDYLENNKSHAVVMELGRFRSQLLLMMTWIRSWQQFFPYLEGLKPIKNLEHIAMSAADNRYPLQLGPVIDIQSAQRTCEVINALGEYCQLRSIARGQSDRQRI